MSRPPKALTQVKKVAPPAVPNDFRHSGSSFGSAGYASSEDGVGYNNQANGVVGPPVNVVVVNMPIGGNGNVVVQPGGIGIVGGGGVLPQHHHQQHIGNQHNTINNGSNQINEDGSGTYGMPAGKSPGPMYTHPGFSFPSMVNKYAHAEDQGKIFFSYLH